MLARIPLLAALAIACAPLMAAAQGEASRPNVLVILTDDQGYADMGVYGSRHIETPHLDRLAREGVMLTQFYAGAPLCSPSRAALLTGRTPEWAGVNNNTGIVSGLDRSNRQLALEQVTMAEVLLEHGYRTALIGKWHLSGTPETTPNFQGFEFSFGHYNGVIDNYSHTYGRPYRHDLYLNGREIFRNGEYFPDLMVEEAIRFIDRQDERPFFLYFAMNAPHWPYQGDADWVEEYRSRGLEFPHDEYAAFTSSLDERIGALLTALRQRGLLDDTIVVFQSDHGHSTEPVAGNGGGSAGIYRGAKFSLFEGGIRVPAIIRWPKALPGGAVRDQFAVSVDWLPTIFDLAGIPSDGLDLNGRSLRAVLGDPDAATPHESYVWRWNDLVIVGADTWAVRRGDWKLLVNPVDTSGEYSRESTTLTDIFLVNLRDDPAETASVHADHPDIVAELLAIRDAYIAELQSAGKFEPPAQ